MKKLANMQGALIFWLLILLSVLNSCDTDRNIDPPYESHFIKYFGTDENESGVDLMLLSDGTLLLLGKSDLGSRRIYLVKVDANGNLIWEKYLGSDTDIPKDIEPTNDGNFVILSDFTPSINNTDIKIIKIDQNGNKLDSVVYGSPEIQTAQSITPLLDGGFIVTGSTEFTEALPKPGSINDLLDIIHYRCDANLVFDDINWEPQYGSGSIDAATKVFQKSINEFYVFGYSDNPHDNNQTGFTNLIYYGLNATGSNNDPNYLGDFLQNTRSSFVMEAPPTFGGGYFILGTKTSTTGLVGLHVSKVRAPLQFDPINDEQLDRDLTIGVGARTYEAVSAAASLTSPQGYLLLANEDRVSGYTNISLSKIDQIGNLLWYVSLGSEEKDDLAAAVTELPDGRIIVLGTVGIGDQTKMALFKLNSTGQLLK